MLQILQSPFRLCDGFRRREFLRVGGLSALGLGLPDLLRAQAVQKEQKHSEQNSPVEGKARGVVLIYLLGGPPQHETWDPKPNAPKEIRGEEIAIPSATPGLFVGQHLPKLSLLTKDLAVLRSVVTSDNAHSSSGYQMLTGVPHVPLNRENATAQTPNYQPSMASMVRYLREDRNGLPSSIVIPRHIANDGEIVWPGQDAGYLGREHDPWIIRCDPSEKGFSIPAISFPEQMTNARFDRRLGLLKQLEQRQHLFDQHHRVSSFDAQTAQALDLIAGKKAKTAFDLSQESPSLREAYGMTRFGQSLLLARRLIEAGVSLVQVNWTRLEGKDNNGTWDTHKNHFKSVKGHLMPILDQSFSAFMKDMKDRGLLDETLVGLLGEFGHTPKLNRNGGRDHWGKVFSIALGGGSIQGGQVIGSSDAHAAYPVSGRVEPKDITASIMYALGYPTETVLYDQVNRPIPISRGNVIEKLFA